MKIMIKILVLVLTILFIISCDDSPKKDSVFSNPAKAYNRSKKKIAETQISTISKAVTSYLADNDRYPDSLEELVPMYLRTDSEIKDPWGSPFEIRNDENGEYYIISAGRDLIFDNEDDIKRSL